MLNKIWALIWNRGALQNAFIYLSILTFLTKIGPAIPLTSDPRVGAEGGGRGVETHRNQMLEDVSAPKQFFFIPSTVPAGHTLLIGLFFAPVSLRSPPYYFFMS